MISLRPETQAMNGGVMKFSEQEAWRQIRREQFNYKVAEVSLAVFPTFLGLMAICVYNGFYVGAAVSAVMAFAGGISTYAHLAASSQKTRTAVATNPHLLNWIQVGYKFEEYPQEHELKAYKHFAANRVSDAVDRFAACCFREEGYQEKLKTVTDQWQVFDDTSVVGSSADIPTYRSHREQLSREALEVERRLERESHNVTSLRTTLDEIITLFKAMGLVDPGFDPTDMINQAKADLKKMHSGPTDHDVPIAQFAAALIETVNKALPEQKY